MKQKFTITVHVTIPHNNNNHHTYIIILTMMRLALVLLLVTPTEGGFFRSLKKDDKENTGGTVKTGVVDCSGKHDLDQILGNFGIVGMDAAALCAEQEEQGLVKDETLCTPFQNIPNRPNNQLACKSSHECENGIPNVQCLIHLSTSGDYISTCNTIEGLSSTLGINTFAIQTMCNDVENIAGGDGLRDEPCATLEMVQATAGGFHSCTSNAACDGDAMCILSPGGSMRCDTLPSQASLDKALCDDVDLNGGVGDDGNIAGGGNGGIKSDEASDGTPGLEIAIGAEAP